MTVSITPLSDALGVEATGIDLAAPVAASDAEAMTHALDEHLVMVVRDQALTPEQFLAAIRLFGDIMPQHLTNLLMDEHPEIAVLDSRNSPVEADGRVFPTGSKAWHADHTNHARPPKITALYAITLPSSGGDTGFANMQKAYAGLPDATRAELAAMTTVNAIERDSAAVSNADREKYGAPQRHPLIRTHPATGRQAIYVHPGKLAHIEGMEPGESRDFIAYLFERVIQPDIIYRHRWRQGDLVLWDNRAIVHKAFHDYDHTEGRIMHRAILEGEVPV